ncbi:hypothetical protein ACLOJK_038963 [Asimina triloba]
MNSYSEVRWGLGIKGYVEQKKRLEEERESAASLYTSDSLAYHASSGMFYFSYVEGSILEHSVVRRWKIVISSAIRPDLHPAPGIRPLSVPPIFNERLSRRQQVDPIACPIVRPRSGCASPTPSAPLPARSSVSFAPGSSTLASPRNPSASIQYPAAPASVQPRPSAPSISAPFVQHPIAQIPRPVIQLTVRSSAANAARRSLSATRPPPVDAARCLPTSSALDAVRWRLPPFGEEGGAPYYGAPAAYQTRYTLSIIRQSMTSAVGPTSVSQSMTSAVGPTSIGQSMTSVVGPTSVSQSMTSVVGPTSVSQSMTSAMGPTSVSQSMTSAMGPTSVSQSMTLAMGPTSVSQSMTSAVDPTSVSQSMTSAVDPTSVNQAPLGCSGASGRICYLSTSVALHSGVHAFRSGGAIVKNEFTSVYISLAHMYGGGDL